MATMTYVPSRVGEGFFTDFQPPASGATDTGKAWLWNNVTGKFEPVALNFDPAGTAAAGDAAHVAASDPHTQYELESANTAAAILTKLLTVDGAGSGLDADLLNGQSSATFLRASGADAGAASSRQVFTNGITAPNWQPASNSTTALQMRDASGTALLTGDTTNLRVGVNGTPSATLDVTAASDATPGLVVRGHSLTQSANLFEVRASNTGPILTLTTLGSLSTSSMVLSNSLLANGADAQGSAPFVLRQLSGSVGVIVTDNGVNTKNAYFGFDSTLAHIAIEALQSGIGWMPICLSPTGGSRVGVFGVTSPTAWLDVGAATTAGASLRLRSGTAPTSPNDGDVWFDGADFKCRIGGVTKTFTVT